MKITLVLLAAMTLSLSNVFAQTPMPVTEVADPAGMDSVLNTIDQQVKRLEKATLNLKKVLNEEFDDQPTQSIITSLPVNADNIDNAVESLDSEVTSSIREKIDTVSKVEKSMEEHIKLIETRLAELNTNEENLQELQAEYKKLEPLLSNPVFRSGTSIESQEKISALSTDLAQLSGWLDNEKKSANQQLGTLKEGRELSARWRAALILERQKQSEKIYNNKLLSEESEQLYNEINQLQEQLIQNNSSLSFAQADEIQRQIYAKNLQLWLIEADKSLVRSMNTFDVDPGMISLKSIKLSELKKQHAYLQEVRKQLKKLKLSIDEKIEETKGYIDARGGEELVGLQQALKQRKQTVYYQYGQLKKQLLYYGSEMSDRNQKILLARDELYSGNHFQAIIRDFPNTLKQVTYQVQISFLALFEQIKARPVFFAIVAVTSFVIFFLCIYIIKNIIALYKEPDTFHFLLSTINKNKYIFIPCVLLVSLVHTDRISYPGGEIILVLVYGLTALVVWLNVIYADSQSSVFEKKRAFYRYIVAILLVGCAVFYAIAQYSPVNPVVLSFYEKILVIMLAIFMWLERKKFIFHPAASNQKMKKFHRIYVEIQKLLPLSVFVACAISLIGFGNLAWYILNYVWVCALYIPFVILGFKLIDFLRKIAKLYSIKHFKHGVFVASDVVSPISIILKILWVCCVSIFTFMGLGIDLDDHAITDFLLFIQSPLIKLGDVEIDLQMIILSLLAIYLVFRFALWLKSFSYKVIYSRIQDLGVRNSLAVFTQYGATLIGLLMVTSLLGIDLTSLTVFAGALGVGIGFGLQDIAKNFISGILLLVERPLHNGDWVNLDSYEGRIKNIGMRAITMETFDRKEVIIPNISAISNSFTNNTHSDPVLRTILYIGADYDSEPETVIAVLKDVMDNNEGILETPGSLAVLWEYADSSINYRIQYYVNTDLHKLIIVRNTVLREIWHRFKKEGIGIPYPQRDVHVHAVTSR